MTHNVYFSISQNTFDIGSKNSVYCQFIFVFEMWFHFRLWVSGPKSSEKAGISRSSESSILSSAFSISSTSTSSDWAYIRSKNVQKLETCNYFNEISTSIISISLAWISRGLGPIVVISASSWSFPLQAYPEVPQ